MGEYSFPIIVNDGNTEELVAYYPISYDVFMNDILINIVKYVDKLYPNLIKKKYNIRLILNPENVIEITETQPDQDMLLNDYRSYFNSPYFLVTIEDLGSTLLDLTPDVIRHIVTDLDIKSILSLCKSNKQLDNIVCKNTFFWKNKFKHLKLPSSVITV